MNGIKMKTEDVVIIPTIKGCVTVALKDILYVTEITCGLYEVVTRFTAFNTDKGGYALLGTKK